MPYLLLGVALLVAVILAARWFANTEPAKAKRALKWVGLTLVAVVVAFLAVTGRLAAAGGLAAMLLPWVIRWRNLVRMARSATGPAAGQSSGVETDFLRMSLDHDTGLMNGEVIKGAYAGRRLDAMSLEELLALMAECRASDPRSVAVLEAYLDRVHGPDWREKEEARAGRGDASAAPMTREEAYEILGLRPGATEAEIKEAHRRLMLKIHPDQGGSTYLATKLNQAKDLLLGR